MDVTQNISNNNKFIKFQNEGFIVEEKFLDQDILLDLQQQMQLVFWTQVVANKLDKSVDNFAEGIVKATYKYMELQDGLNMQADTFLSYYIELKNGREPLRRRLFKQSKEYGQVIFHGPRDSLKITK